jgi:hypothetical protein
LDRKWNEFINRGEKQIIAPIVEKKLLQQKTYALTFILA